MGYRSFRERTCSWGRSLLNARIVLHRKRQRQSAGLVRLKPRRGDWQRAWRRPVRDTQRKWRNRKRGFVLASHIFPSGVASKQSNGFWCFQNILRCVWTCFYPECCVSGVVSGHACKLCLNRRKQERWHSQEDEKIIFNLLLKSCCLKGM